MASVVLVFASLGIGWGAPQRVNSVEWYSAHVEARDVELERCGALRSYEGRSSDQNCINASEAKAILDDLVRVGASSSNPRFDSARQAGATSVADPGTIEARN